MTVSVCSKPRWAKHRAAAVTATSHYDPVTGPPQHAGRHVDGVRTLMVSRGYRAAIWTTSPAAPLIACTAIGCRNLRGGALAGCAGRHCRASGLIAEARCYSF